MSANITTRGWIIPVGQHAMDAVNHLDGGDLAQLGVTASADRSGLVGEPEIALFYLDERDEEMFASVAGVVAKVRARCRGPVLLGFSPAPARGDEIDPARLLRLANAFDVCVLQVTVGAVDGLALLVRAWVEPLLSAGPIDLAPPDLVEQARAGSAGVVVSWRPAAEETTLPAGLMALLAPHRATRLLVTLHCRPEVEMSRINALVEAAMTAVDNEASCLFSSITVDVPNFCEEVLMSAMWDSVKVAAVTDGNPELTVPTKSEGA